MKTGRPSIQPAERKGRILTLRVNEPEAETLDKAVQIKGLKLSAWARQTLLQEARRIQDQVEQ